MTVPESTPQIFTPLDAQTEDVLKEMNFFEEGPAQATPGVDEALWTDIPQHLPGHAEGHVSLLAVDGKMFAEQVSRLGGGCLVLETRDDFDFYQSAEALSDKETADMATRAVDPVQVAAHLGHFASQARLVLVSGQDQCPLPTKLSASMHKPHVNEEYLDLTKVVAVYKPPVSRK